MKLYELQELQALKQWRRFIFTSENQTVKTTVALDLTFEKMMIFPHYTEQTIALYGGSGCMAIQAVNAVLHNVCALGDIIQVKCGNGEIYTIVAQS